MGLLGANCKSCGKGFLWYTGSQYGQMCEQCIAATASASPGLQKLQYFRIEAKLKMVTYQSEESDKPWQGSKSAEVFSEVSRETLGGFATFAEAHEHGAKMLANALEEAFLTNKTVHDTCVRVVREDG